jgi:nucleoside 2-deoxyribosyltransferase
MRKIKIYLAGSIYTEEPGISWKKRFRDQLDPVLYRFFDPDPVNEPEYFMIARDKAEIENCDIFVAYIERPSFGTAMEILHSFNQQKTPILIINPGMKFETDLWLSYHSHSICDSVENCVEHIKTMRFQIFFNE